jgi:hypothetical protein
VSTTQSDDLERVAHHFGRVVRGGPPTCSSRSRRTRSSRVAFFNIMHAGVPAPLVEEAFEAFGRAQDRLVDGGGKSYLADWLPGMGPAGWSAHFGGQVDRWEGDKKVFDPAGLFCSHLLP